MTRLHATFATLVLLVLMPHDGGAQSGDPRGLRVDSMFARYNSGVSPGLAVAVVQDGAVILRRGYGMANLEHRVPITPATVFDVASVSKQFTGLAVAMLIQQGKIGLNDDIRKYVPALYRFEPAITVNHLLHHTSGLRDWPGTLTVGGWRYDDVIAFDQILTMAYHQRTLNYVPGAEYSYSNTGYNVLAEMVQRVSGQTFRQFTDSAIFRPLGMTRSFFRDDYSELTADRATGYARGADGSFHNTPNQLTALGSSSLFSTVDDLAKWVINFDNAAVGGAAAISMTRTRGVLNDRSTIPYAFGVTHGEYGGLPTVNHSGSWASFSTYIVHFPAQKLGVVVLANSGSINATDAALRVAGVYLDGLVTPVATTPATLPRVAPTVAPALLEEYAGMYRLGTGWYTRISRSGNTLSSQATREEPAPLTARSDHDFWVERYGAAMTFERDAAGKVVSLLYKGYHAPKMDESAPQRNAPNADYVGEYESEELGTFYQVREVANALELVHRRHGVQPLTRIWNDDFTTPAWYIKSAAFTRDSAGQVNGMAVNGDARSRDIHFTKRTVSRGS